MCVVIALEIFGVVNSFDSVLCCNRFKNYKPSFGTHAWNVPKKWRLKLLVAIFVVVQGVNLFFFTF